MISVVMFSGGLESTASLVRLLKETDDRVVAHHIQLKTHEKRFTAEAQAVSKMVPYLRKKYRDFRFNVSSVEIPGLDADYHGWDILAICWMGGYVVKGIHIQAGCSVPMRLLYGMASDEVDTYNRLSARIEAAHSMFNDHFYDYKEHGLKIPTVQSVIRELTAKQVYDRYIDDDLDKMIISCRRPKRLDNGSFIECGFCHSCEKMGKLRRD
jgi:hypothetical protein